MKINHKQFYQACRAVLEHCKDGYAISYARRGLDMIDEDEIRVQALYILSNMVYWRGPMAKQVRIMLKAATGEG